MSSSIATIIALVVLVAIFTGRLGIFSQDVQKTEESTYSFACQKPGSDNRCAFDSPSGYDITPLSADESGCGALDRLHTASEVLQEDLMC